MTKNEAIEIIKNKGYVRFEDADLARKLEHEVYVVTCFGSSFEAEEQEF